MRLRHGQPARRQMRARWAVSLCCGAALLWNIALQRALAAGPVTLAEYAGVVARAGQLAGEAGALNDGAQRQALCRQAADMLDGIRTVTLESGDSLTVDNHELIAGLRQQEPTQAVARALQQRLDTLRDGLATPAAAPDPANREKLRALLANPPFTQPIADDSLSRLIDELLSRLFGGAARGVFNIGPVIAVLGILLASGVLVGFVLALRRTGASEAALPLAEASGAEAATASQAFSGAERFITAGDYRTAVRLLYLGTLLRLDERGLLRFDRSLTNREYLRAVAASPNIQDALRPVVETFDRTWYGYGPISAGEFAQYQAQVEAVRNAHLA